MVNFNSFRVSASGMSAERVRLDVIASNIANADSTNTPEGGPYVRKQVHFASVLGDSWQASPTAAKTAVGVRVTGIIKDPSPLRMVYDPNHPDANNQGYVAMPNVDVVTEMTDMVAATRAYEANVTAFNAAKAMYQKSLEIGS